MSRPSWLVVLLGCLGCGRIAFDRTDDSGSDGPTLQQTGYIKASNAGVGDSFGGGVALSADGNTLAVSAPNEDGGSPGIDGNQADEYVTNAGAVYVFVRDDETGWRQQAYLKASNPGVEDGFGVSLTLSNDGDTLAVGAYFEDSSATGIDGVQTDNSAPDAGAAYVFTRTGSVWQQTAYVKASNARTGDVFGGRVALSGDGTTLAVASPYENCASTGIDGPQFNFTGGNSGAVFLFVRSGDVWAQQAYVKASNTGVDDVFGSSVSLSANGSVLAVGARGEDSGATGINGAQDDNSAVDAGALYVFALAGTTWAQEAYIKASNASAGDDLGFMSELSGDGTTLAAGAFLEDSPGRGVGSDQSSDAAGDAGAAYVFTRSSPGAWSQQSYVKASNTDPGDRFGLNVRLSSDGRLLAIGANSEASGATGVDADQADNSAPNAGALYLLVLGTTWSQRAYLKPTNIDAGDGFGAGAALSISGNVLAVGAPGEDSAARGIGGDPGDNAAPDAGAVYMFQGL